MSNTTRKRNPVFKLLILLLVALFVVGLVVWLTLFSRPYYYRDASRIGPSEEYENLMNPQFSYRPEFAGVLDSITSKTNGLETEIKIPAKDDFGGYVDNTLFEYHHLEQNEVLEFAEGKVWLNDLLVSYDAMPIDKLNHNEVKIRGRIFDALLQEIPVDDPEKGYLAVFHSFMMFGGKFPALRFDLQTELSEEMKVVGIHAFDALTHKQIGQSFGATSSSSGLYEVPMDILLWHSTPIELVTDIAFGPPEVFELPMESGARVKFPEGELVLLAMVEGFTGYSQSARFSETTFLLKQSLESSTVDDAVIVFASLPLEKELPVEIEFLNDQEKPIPTLTLGNNDLTIFNLKILTTELAAIEKIRIKYYTKQKRFIFHLPGLPGLPDTNQNIENLFDVQIPYIRFQRADKFRQGIENLTQLTVIGTSAPNNAFSNPTVFENITVKELVDEYAKLYGPAYGAEINQENLTIEFLDMSLKARAERLWEEVKSKFQ